MIKYNKINFKNSCKVNMIRTSLAANTIRKTLKFIVIYIIANNNKHKF